MKKIEAFKEKMNSDQIIKGKELYLTGLVLFLLGLVIGMICSPRKYQVIASNNGSYNGIGTEEEDEEE